MIGKGGENIQNIMKTAGSFVQLANKEQRSVPVVRVLLCGMVCCVVWNSVWAWAGGENEVNNKNENLSVHPQGVWRRGADGDYIRN